MLGARQKTMQVTILSEDGMSRHSRKAVCGGYTSNKGYSTITSNFCPFSAIDQIVHTEGAQDRSAEPAWLPTTTGVVIHPGTGLRTEFKSQGWTAVGARARGTQSRPVLSPRHEFIAWPTRGLPGEAILALGHGIHGGDKCGETAVGVQAGQFAVFPWSSRAAQLTRPQSVGVGGLLGNAAVAFVLHFVRHSRPLSCVRSSFPLSSEVAVIKHLLTVGIQGPIIAFTYEPTKNTGA